MISGSYEDQLSECPACGNQAVLSGSIDVDWDADFDRDGTPIGAFPIVTFTPSSFDCAVCGLMLAGSAELNATGLGGSIPLQDVDPSDFYSEPDF
jgi:hypothetical protein